MSRWGMELSQALSTQILLLHFQLTWQNHATPSFEERTMPFPQHNSQGTGPLIHDQLANVA